MFLLVVRQLPALDLQANFYRTQLSSVAKLVLYTLCAGIHPDRTLPVVLDVGTDNEGLRNDELYLGLRRPRTRGEEYDAFIDRFLQACQTRFPKAYIVSTRLCHLVDMC